MKTFNFFSRAANAYRQTVNQPPLSRSDYAGTLLVSCVVGTVAVMTIKDSIRKDDMKKTIQAINQQSEERIEAWTIQWEEECQKRQRRDDELEQKYTAWPPTRP